MVYYLWIGKNGLLSMDW